MEPTQAPKISDEKYAPVVDSMLAGDLKDLINTNPDIKCSEAFKELIFNIKDDETLLKVTTQFGSIEIIDVKIITEELLIKDLFS
jgi:hypothetical protein